MSLFQYPLRTLGIVGACALAVAFAPQASAQDTPVGGVPGRTLPGQENETNRIVAVWAHADNKFLVEVAQMAAQRANHDQVKQFAQQIVKTHQACIDKLQKHTGKTAGAADASTGRDPLGAGGRNEPRDPRTGGQGQNDPRTGGQGQNDPRTGGQGQNDPRTGGQRPAGGTGQPADAGMQRGQVGQLDHASLLMQLAQKRIETAREMLQGKQGQEFDQAFLGMELMALATTVDDMQVLQQYATGDLKQAFAQEIQELQQQQQRAESLMQTISKASTPSDGGRGR